MTSSSWMRAGPLISLVVILLITLPPAVIAEPYRLQLFTEEFPPYNYSENAEIKGISTQIVTAALRDAGYEYDIKSFPWARSFKLAQETPDSLIFSISRRSNREELFQWVSKIIPRVTYSVYALRSRDDINIGKIGDMKGYQIGTNVDDAREAYLISKGFEKADFQRISGQASQTVNYRKLKVGRIDLWPMPDAVAKRIALDEGDEPETMLRKVFSFDELASDGYYLAASRDTPVEVVETIAASIERYRKTDEYRALMFKLGLRDN